MEATVVRAHSAPAFSSMVSPIREKTSSHLTGAASSVRMDKNTLHPTTKALAALLLGASSLIGCDVEDEGPGAYDEEAALDLEDEGEDVLVINDAVLGAIAGAPALADEDVEALFAENEPTLRDVISLVDLELLPPELTLEDLDSPVILDVAEPPTEALPNESIDDFSAELEPQFLGEQACATTSISNATNGATVAMSTPPNCGYATDGATSPNTSYNPSGCPNQFITHVNGTYGNAFSFYSNWHGTSLDETYCELSSKALSAYGGRWTIQLVNGSWYFSLTWTKLGTTVEHGQWSSSGWFPGCYWQYDNGYGPIPSLSSGHFYNRVRTATQGVVLAIFPFKQRVEGGIHHGPGPC
ncbi:MAG: hypothetical protein KUG77_01860 [Nannocystaceae bacterium]|nr:hypothetical protein [Nannocystaceae bacterium]